MYGEVGDSLALFQYEEEHPESVGNRIYHGSSNTSENYCRGTTTVFSQITYLALGCDCVADSMCIAAMFLPVLQRAFQLNNKHSVLDIYAKQVVTVPCAYERLLSPQNGMLAHPVHVVHVDAMCLAREQARERGSMSHSVAVPSDIMISSKDQEIVPEYPQAHQTASTPARLTRSRALELLSSRNVLPSFSQSLCSSIRRDFSFCQGTRAGAILRTMAGKRSIRRVASPSQKDDKKYEGKDVEDRGSSRPAKDRKHRFRDQERDLEPDDQRRVEFKQKLMDSVESSRGLEDFRKSDEEVFIHTHMQDFVALLTPHSSRISAIRKYEHFTASRTSDWTIGWKSMLWYTQFQMMFLNPSIHEIMMETVLLREGERCRILPAISSHSCQRKSKRNEESVEGMRDGPSTSTWSQTSFCSLRKR